jgi:hypothetical protein
MLGLKDYAKFYRVNNFKSNLASRIHVPDCMMTMSSKCLILTMQTLQTILAYSSNMYIHVCVKEGLCRVNHVSINSVQACNVAIAMQEFDLFRRFLIRTIILT